MKSIKHAVWAFGLGNLVPHISNVSMAWGIAGVAIAHILRAIYYEVTE